MAITTSPARRSVALAPESIRSFFEKVLRSFKGQAWNPASKHVLCSPSWIERWNEAFGESMDHEINLGTIRFPGRPVPRQHLCGVSENRSVHEQGLGELREFVARQFHQEGMGAISPSEEVLITQGATGALRIVLDTFTEKGDSLVLFDPGSPWYSHQARCRGLKVRWVEQRHDHTDGRICLKQLERAMRGSRLMVIASPGNPGGYLLSPDERDHIGWLANRHDVLVVWDETFHCFLDAEVTSKHSTPDRTRNRSLIIGELDKSLGLESLQIGWIIGPRSRVSSCLLTSSMNRNGPPPWNQSLALGMVNDRLPGSASLIEAVRAKASYTFDRLIGMGLETRMPEHGPHFWVRVPEKWSDGRRFARDLKKHQQVRVIPGDLFGPSGKKFIQMCSILEEGRLEEGLNRIRREVSDSGSVKKQERVVA